MCSRRQPGPSSSLAAAVASAQVVCAGGVGGSGAATGCARLAVQLADRKLSEVTIVALYLLANIRSVAWAYGKRATERAVWVRLQINVTVSY